MTAWGYSDVGKVRKNNQDAYHISMENRKKTALAVVCDGMGGAAAGNLASELALKAFVDCIKAFPHKSISEEQLRALLKDAADAANAAVFNRAAADKTLHGMGTTLVGTVVSCGYIGIINIGDSRAYHIDHDGISRITRDHSLVEDMVLMGELTEEQAKAHPGKNLITRAVGTDSSVSGDVYIKKVQPESFILLCTDGLSNLVTEQEMLYEVIYGGPRSMCCKRLIDIANRRGGYDNITAVLLSV